MLILERRANEEVILDKKTRATVVSATSETVTLRLRVPQGVCVHRIAPQESLDCEAVLVSELDTVVT